VFPISAQPTTAATATLERPEVIHGQARVQERESTQPEPQTKQADAGGYDADVVVIGGGPGGYVAALRAAELGGKAIVIERDNVGGTCLNWGCIPSKALLSSAELLNQAREASKFGVKIDNVSVDLPGMMKHKEQIVTQLRSGTEFLLKKAKVEVIRDTGRLLKGNVVQVGDRKIKARNVILAMGSVVARPPIPGLGDNYITSNEALSLQPLPKSICIIGAGAVGLELGFFWHSCGVEVTVAEMFPHIGTGLDAEISDELERALKKSGMRIHTGAKAQRIEDVEGGREVVCETAQGELRIKAEVLMLATGRWPASKDQGLEELGLKMERGFVQVNEKLETNLPGVYAIGDLIGGFMLAHKAHHEGAIAAENAMGRNKKMSYRAIPVVIFTNPEVASVGLTEAEAREAGYDVKTGKFPFRVLGKSLAIGNRTGFAKVIADQKYGEILGVHLIGPHVTDMISEAAVAIESEATVEELAHSVHPHPTLSEAIMEAALDVFGMSVHKG
jgi:dihydrolipoamide dehydrogenase